MMRCHLRILCQVPPAIGMSSNVAEQRSGVSAAGHAEGEGDEIELFAPRNPLEGGQRLFSFINTGDDKAVRESYVGIVISLMTQLLQVKETACE